jgi:hypothetical protein
MSSWLCAHSSVSTDLLAVATKASSVARSLKTSNIGLNKYFDG